MLHNQHLERERERDLSKLYYNPKQHKVEAQMIITFHDP